MLRVFRRSPKLRKDLSIKLKSKNQQKHEKHMNNIKKTHEKHENNMNKNNNRKAFVQDPAGEKEERVPLLCCGAEDVRVMVQDRGLEMAEKAEESVAEKLGKQMDEAIIKAEEKLKKGLKQVNPAMQPQVRALKAVMSNKNFRNVYGSLPADKQKALLGAMKVIGDTDAGKKFSNKMKNFEDVLKTCEGRTCHQGLEEVKGEELDKEDNETFYIYIYTIYIIFL